ncbi:MAG TPA: hypothetical protein VMU20_12330 [Candidatus Dormibacteraeota bacterium]|nr:hypothetical protein [Candidatus Dormibacteraeota bacterium]
MNEFTGNEWTVLVSSQPPGYDVTGMYLLWGSDRERLLEIARAEIAGGRFHEARLSVVPGRRPAEHVLCLLAPDGAQRVDLARRVRDSGGGITYLYWKDGTALPVRREVDVTFGDDGGEPG